MSQGVEYNLLTTTPPGTCVTWYTVRGQSHGTLLSWVRPGLARVWRRDGVVTYVLVGVGGRE